MRRWPLTILSAVLLLLCLVGWARSHLPEYYTIRAHEGALVFLFYGRDQAPAMDPANHPAVDNHSDPRFRRPISRLDTEQALGAARRWGPSNVRTIKWRRLGFELIATLTNLRWGYFVAAVPFWFLALPPAAGLVCGVLAIRRQRARLRHGLCRNCGYDMRASPDQCPECGTARTAPTPT